MVETLGKSFEVDLWDLRQKTLTQLARTVKTADARSVIAKSAIDLAEQAIPDSHYDAATALTAIALNLSISLKDNSLRDQCREMNERIKRLQKEQPNVEVARTKLKTAPDDADANLTLGRFVCFLQGDWKAGLANLSKGSRRGPQGPCQAGTRRSDRRQGAGQAGRRLVGPSGEKGKRKDDPIIKAMHARAMYWYRLALPNLSGLTLAKVQKRIDAEEASKPEAPITETAFLDDLPEQNLSKANASLGKHGETGYDQPRGFGGFGRGRRGGGIPANVPKSVALGGVEIKHALSLMPKSDGDATVAFNLDGKYREFRGTAAIMDGDNPQGAVLFKVFSDGKLIWTSKPMRRAGEFQTCVLRIAKTQALQFQILCKGSNANAHTVWIDPAVGR